MGSVGKTTSSFNEERFENRMDSYIGGGYQIAGPGGIFDKDDITYIEKNMQETSRSMFRVEDNDWTAKDLKVGDSIDFNNDYKSFTKSLQGVNRILEDGEEWDTYQTPVVFKTMGTQRYFDVQEYGRKIGNSFYDYQQEAFLKGKKWKIRQITTQKFNGKNVKVVVIG